MQVAHGMALSNRCRLLYQTPNYHCCSNDMRVIDATIVLLINPVLIFNEGRACAMDGLLTCHDASSDMMRTDHFFCIQYNTIERDVMGHF